MAVGSQRDGDTKFDRGLDSASDPITLPPGCYCFGANILNRGGAIQTRPGFNWSFSMPPGKLQGMATFIPLVGKPVLIVFVSGQGYSSQFPYKTVQLIQGATMSADADQVFFAMCTQTVQNNADGSLDLIAPRQLLMCQDGINPPAYYDGRVLTAVTGANVTPQGTFIAWVGARLWVARGNLLFSSDISNPLSFLEQTYNTLGGVDYFTLPDNCTGLAAQPGTSLVNTQLFAFTQTTTTVFQASILNRTLWPTTSNFQFELFSTVGCIAAKSIIAVSGMLWWFSAFGFTRLDWAQQSNITTKIFRIDREMTRSSVRLYKDLSKVVAASYENFVLISVPYCSLRNKHTWVYDASTNDLASQNQMAYLTSSWSSTWASIWTGVSPVDWCSVIIDGDTKLFCASADDDGINRVYEAFSEEKRDNSCDFPWSFETRAYTAQNPMNKHFRFMSYSLSELQGEVNLKISWAGATRGRWKPISKPVFYAEEGSLDNTKVYSASDILYGLKKQSRIARTEDVRDLSEDKFSSAGIEGLVEPLLADKESIDTAFQFRFDGSGPCAIRNIVVFMDPVAPSDSGQDENPKPEQPDTRFVRYDGAASKVEADLEESSSGYPATSSAQAVWDNFVGKGTATIVGTITSQESQKRAQQVAMARAQQYIAATATPYVGGKLVGESGES